MPAATYPNRDEMVLARVPAGAARYAAEHLHSAAREAEAAGLHADRTLLVSAGDALHAAGWQDNAGLDAAAAHLERCDNLNVPTVALHLPHELADALLVARSWRIETVPGGRAYVKPGRKLRAEGGIFGDDYLWERDEAVTVALAAEALGVNR